MSTIRTLPAVAAALVLTACAGGTSPSTPSTTTRPVEVAPVPGVLSPAPSTIGTTPAIPTPVLPPLFSVPDGSTRHAWSDVLCVEGHAVSVHPDTPAAWADAVKYCESSRPRSSTRP